MFTREDAIKAIAEKFPETKTMTGTDYINGGTKSWVESPETRLHRMINLHEPELDGLKEGNSGLEDSREKSFRDSVEHDFKNENGLW
jgi:hypothetical protein